MKFFRGGRDRDNNNRGGGGGGGGRGNDRNRRDSEGMKNQHYINPKHCDYCSKGMPCPYMWQAPDSGIWYHDTSGKKRYIQDVIIEGQFGEVPDTPRCTCVSSGTDPNCPIHGWK